MWKKKLEWKNDSIEFTFQDRVVSLEESIQDDEMRFKATMKNGNQFKEIELRMCLKTVNEENNNPLKETGMEKRFHRIFISRPCCVIRRKYSG